MQQTTTIVKYRGLTNPLTCATCGEVIARGAAMSWKRKGTLRFWHTPCGAPKKARRLTEAKRLMGALRRIAEAS